MPDIQIRQASPEDIETIAEILQEAAAWAESLGAPLWNVADLDADAIRGEVAAGLYWLAHANDELAGCLRYQLEDALFWPDKPIGEAVYLHRLAVRRAHAGGEVSQALIDWAKAHARDRGHDYMRLDCDADRPALRALYERHGFNAVGEREVGPHTVILLEFELNPSRDAD